MIPGRIRNYWLHFNRTQSLRHALAQPVKGKLPSPFDLTEQPTNIMRTIARCSTFLELERVASYDPFPMRDEGGKG